ncbi:unnamed protein product [Adineta steineri]|uniref:Uncharacterized protein n=1 Tax=Adineta steineri TaxID=433720 RepID=A0A819RSH1_9BILA|nr:unnamed protein product [Adineta steineri]CAF4057653.1 unnamed protein product [Adineta steineri]
MSAPTGMGRSTAIHFYDVAARMQQELGNNNGHQLHNAYGYARQHQPTHAVAYASHMPNNDHVNRQDTRGFFELFWDNLFHKH